MILRKNGVDMVETADAAPGKQIQIPVKFNDTERSKDIEIRISGLSVKDIDNISIYFRGENNNG